ncbi:outer membrane beta-barrel protein [Herminiimonas arsenitoxidans]|uniref:outer membrane beta-barrel protein n=1 Tax=Herminiimonas arsenitoxidans TaxID=1809410 RepID=UPI00097079E3|nr:outer membrane beta-barrel protein [Herminiimonas arsenitoxidans]
MFIYPLAAALFLIASATVYAEEKNSRHFYLGIDAASGKAREKSHPAGFRVTSETGRVTGGRLFAGYQFDEKIGLELGMVRSSNYKQSATNGFASYDAVVETKNYDLVLVYKLTDYLPGFFLTGGMSYKTARTTAAVRVPVLSISTNVSEEKSSSNFLIGAGYEANISGSLDGRINYARYGEENFLTFGVKYRFE